MHYIVQPHDQETSLALLLGILLLSYLFPFRNTRLSMYWGSRRERR